jgi:copper chaperone CopZ
MPLAKNAGQSALHNITALKLSIGGMNCGACVRRISKTLDELDGIDTVEINLASKSARIQFNSAQTDSAAIITAIVEAGYQASPLAQPSTTA